jgi:hypothetical protein
MLRKIGACGCHDQLLRNGNGTQAIVAGSALLMYSATHVADIALKMLSSDSRSRMWDKDVNSCAYDEGCTAIVPKALSKPIEDNDSIECITERLLSILTDRRAVYHYTQHHSSSRSYSPDMLST